MSNVDVQCVKPYGPYVDLASLKAIRERLMKRKEEFQQILHSIQQERIKYEKLLNLTRSTQK